MSSFETLLYFITEISLHQCSTPVTCTAESPKAANTICSDANEDLFCFVLVSPDNEQLIYPLLPATDICG